MTAFQSQQQGVHSMASQRGSWDFDSPMAAAISASMEGERVSAYMLLLCGRQVYANLLYARFQVFRC